MMWGLDWAELKPGEKVLFVLLTVSAVAATLTFVVMVAKLTIEWLGYLRSKELVKAAHDLLLADAQLRRDIYTRTQKVERVAEGTHEAIQDLQQKAEKVSRDTSAVKQVVIEGSTPQSLPKPQLPPI